MFRTRFWTCCASKKRHLRLECPLMRNKNTDDKELDRPYKFREGVGADTANEAVKRRNYKIFVVPLYHIFHEVFARPLFLKPNI